MKVPDPQELSREFGETLLRMQDPSPCFPAIEDYIQRTKREDFLAGRGPDGPHPPLALSTRRRHRTGIPAYNTGDLMRSHTEPGHPHYVFRDVGGGFDYGSTHPAITWLEQSGYRLEGLAPEVWEVVDEIMDTYIFTGEILNV